MIRIRRRSSTAHPTSGGYMLLVLMIAVAVMSIGFLQVARNYRRSIQRDREVEMIHRGEQYERAIRRYYRKFNRYPASIEQLENSNNLRFLRKRYTDPMSPDGTWRILHESDIRRSPTGVITLAPSGGLNGNAIGNMNDAAQDSGSSVSPDASATDTSRAGSGTQSQNPSAPTSATGTGGSTSIFGSSSNNNAATSGQPLGGGALIGVVSKSKEEGVHIFAKKSKYSEWFFIYDPSQDTGQGRLPIGPYNPNALLNTLAPGATNPTGAGGSSSPTTPSSSGPGSSNSSSTPAPQ